MPTHRTDADFMVGDTEPQPRLRVNRSEPLSLSTTWQRLDFNGTSNRNGNTFPSVSQTMKKVDWDKTNKLLRFMSSVDRNYDIQISTKTTSLSLLTVGALLAVQLQMRFVVPSPTPVAFPLPDSDGFVDLYAINLLSSSNGSFGIPVYANSEIRQYGLGVEFRLSSSLIGGVLVACDCVVYGR